MKEFRVRFAVREDAPALLNLYTPYIRDTAITFEYEVPSVPEFAGRIETVLQTHPWLVCEADGAAAGYAYAAPFRPRAAFRWDAETSVYLAPAFQRRGVASALYRCLEAILTEQGCRNAYALITHPHPASEGFHRSMGYRPLCVYRGAGCKFGRWYDLAVLEKRLLPLTENPEPFRPFPELTEAFLTEQLRRAEKELNRRASLDVF